MVTIPYWFIRYALPAGFLVVGTATILLIRPSLHEASFERPTLREPVAIVEVAPEPPRTRSARVVAYSVRSGDTLGTIAERFGTTVESLLALNPGIDPQALRVGQSIRVE